MTKDRAYKFRPPGSYRNGSFDSLLNGREKLTREEKEDLARDKANKVIETVARLEELGQTDLASLLLASSREVIDWEECVAAVTQDDIREWSDWRNRDQESIRDFVSRKRYGKYKGGFALPIYHRDGSVIGVHCRPDLKKWKVYPTGAPLTALIYGNPETAEIVFISESPFDSDRIIDALELDEKPSGRWAMICTRGANNAKCVEDAFLDNAKIIFVMQEDAAAERWKADLSDQLLRPYYELRIPSDLDKGKNGDWIKDFDDWFRYGKATVSELKEVLSFALNVIGPRKPVLVLPSSGYEIQRTAGVMARGLAKAHCHFFRDGRLVEIRRSPVDKDYYLHRPEPVGFCSDLESYFDLRRYRLDKDLGLILKPERCSVETAAKLLAAAPTAELSLPLRQLVNVPVMLGDGGILRKGYHPDSGGIFVTRDLDLPSLSLEEAKKILTDELFADYLWVAASDLSRAVAQVISPALKMGGIIDTDFPIDLAEANESQTGKTLRIRITATIYGESPYPVTRPDSGAKGSLDEEFGAALVSGKLFVCIDNLKGTLNSQKIESALKGTGEINVRLPYERNARVSTRHCIYQLTANAAHLSKDLVNRCIVVRSRKQPEDYKTRAKLPWGMEPFLDYIRKNQARFLGAVYRVVDEWIFRGKPRTQEHRHDFAEWAQSLDWIVQNLLGLSPLLDDTKEIRERLSSPAWKWLRQICFAVRKEGKLDQPLIASDLAEISQMHDLSIPNCRSDSIDENRPRKQIGLIMAGLYRKGNPETPNSLSLEEFLIVRGEVKASQGHRSTPAYTFRLKNPLVSKGKKEIGAEVGALENSPTSLTSSALEEEEGRAIDNSKRERDRETKWEVESLPFEYVTDPDGLLRVAEDLSLPGHIALDIETYDPHVKVSKAGKRARSSVKKVTDRFYSRIRLLQLYRFGAEKPWLIDVRMLETGSGLSSEAFTKIKAILAEREIVGHNVTCFDLPCVYEHLGIQASRIIDTLTLSRIVTNNLRAKEDESINSLSFVFREVGLSLPKDQGETDWGIPDLTREQLTYAANDVFHFERILAHYEAIAEKEGLADVWALEKALAPVVVDMTNYGMYFDKENSKGFALIFGAKATLAERKLREWLGVDGAYVIANPEKLKEAFRAKGLELDDVQERTLKEADSEGANLALEWKAIQNKECKFLDLLGEATRPDSRIHATYNPTGTVTGRFSSKSPNLQQIPRGATIRKLFTAPEGRSLVIADFTQMELVIAAVIAGEEIMLDAFRNGVDVHKLTASLVTGTALDSVDKEQRQMAKAVNFGLLYGQGAGGFQRYAKDKYGIELSMAEAEDLRNRFFESYPGLVAWHKKAKGDADGSAMEVRTALGRVQYLEPEEWWPRFTALVNTPVQGGCADIMKRVMVALADRLKGKARIVNVVHDEVILETEDADAEYAKKVVGETMVEMPREIYPGAPMAAEIGVGKSWADKH